MIPQCKILNDKIKGQGVIKQVWNLSLEAGNSLSDADIIGAKQVVLYYTNNTQNYINSLIISKNSNNWSMALGESNGLIVGYLQVDFTTGAISSSSGTNSTIKCIGYDVIK